MKTSFRSLWPLLALTLAFLSGCAGFPSRHADEHHAIHKAGAQALPSTAYLLEYFHRIGNLSGAALRQEQQRAEDAFARDPSLLNRMQLVLLLSLPQSPWENDARALSLLHGASFPVGVQNEKLADFVHLLDSMLTDRELQDKRMDALRAEYKRLGDRYDGLAAERAADRRKMDERYALTEQKLKAEQKRADTAEKQLQAVKNMERALNRRWVGKR